MSIRFNGNSSNFLQRTTSLPDYNSAYTILMWVKIINDTNNFASFFNLAVTSNLNFDLGQFGADGTSTVIAARISGSGANGNGSNNSTGVWKHFAMVRRSASLLELYEDAVFKASVTTNITGRSALNTFDIGRTNLNGFTGEPIDCECAHLRVWTTDLSTAEILTEFSSASVVKTGSLYGVYPMSTGATAGDDTSGQSHPFTINGTITTGASDPVIGLPTANAGFDQVREENETVMLDSSQSTDAIGIASRSWTQISGTSVTLSDTTAVNPTFLAPSTASPIDLVFRVTVTDTDSNTAQDDVTITIVPASSTAWRWYAPQEAGFNPSRLYAALAGLQTPSMIVRNGRIVGTKGDITNEGFIWSGSKSLVALIFARLLHLGSVGFEDTVPSSDNPISPLATFRQFLCMTSDFALDQPSHSPGNHYAYNNLAIHHYGTYLKTTFFAGDTHVQFLQNALATAIGCEDTLTYNTSGLMSGWDGGWSMSTRDLARFCQLVLNQGSWNGSQLINAQFCSELFAHQIPAAATESSDFGDVQSNESAAINADLSLGYSHGFWLPHRSKLLGGVKAGHEATAMAGAFGTSAYISRTANILVVAVNVGGVTTNDDTVKIPGDDFDLVVEALSSGDPSKANTLRPAMFSPCIPR